MELTDEDVREILDLIDKSAFDYFEIEYRGLRLTVSKSPGRGGARRGARIRTRRRSPILPAPRKTRDIPDGLAAIPAPMVGTFYPAPAARRAALREPGRPGRARHHGRADRGDEGVHGRRRRGRRQRSRRRWPATAEGVEYGEPLFLVRPDAP